MERQLYFLCIQFRGFPLPIMLVSSRCSCLYMVVRWTAKAFICCGFDALYV